MSIKLTEEQRKISNKNHDIAKRYFEKTGELPKDRKPYEYVFHHIPTDLIDNDIDRYISWNIKDLIVMKASEHAYIHNNKLAYDEEYQKILYEKKKPFNQQAWEYATEDYMIEAYKRVAESLKGRKCTWGNKISESTKGRKGASTGKHWFNNGITETYDFKCPIGFTKGRLKGALNRANEERMKRYAELTQNEV